MPLRRVRLSSNRPALKIRDGKHRYKGLRKGWSATASQKHAIARRFSTPNDVFKTTSSLSLSHRSRKLTKKEEQGNSSSGHQSAPREAGRGVGGGILRGFLLKGTHHSPPAEKANGARGEARPTSPNPMPQNTGGGGLQPPHPHNLLSLGVEF